MPKLITDLKPLLVYLKSGVRILLDAEHQFKYYDTYAHTQTHTHILKRTETDTHTFCIHACIHALVHHQLDKTGQMYVLLK